MSGLTYTKACATPGMLFALPGLEPSEFKTLLPYFQKALEAHLENVTVEGKQREEKSFSGSPEKIKSPRHGFALSYYGRVLNPRLTLILHELASCRTLLEIGRAGRGQEQVPNSEMSDKQDQTEGIDNGSE